MARLISRSPRPTRALLGAILLLMAGCQKVTEIVVSIDSDLAIPKEMDSVELRVDLVRGADQEMVAANTWQVDANKPNAVSLPGTVGLLPGDDVSVPVLVKATAFLHGQERLNRRAQLTFVEGRILLLRLNLLRNCLYVVCMPSETCGENGCEPYLKDSSKLPDYTAEEAFKRIDAGDVGTLDAPPDGGAPDRTVDAMVPDAPVFDAPVPDLPVPDLPVPDLIPTCSSSNPQLAGAQDVASHLQANMLPSCTGLSLFETLHSKLGIAKKPVANDHTTLLAYSILLHYISISLALSAFNASDYPCGSGPNGYTLCPSASPVPAGDFVVLFSVLEKTIPLSDPTNHYQYGFVFDADGVAANNYQPSAQYPNDFFKDTDRWYEANYDPTNGWSMKVTDASGGTITPATSTSRIIIKDNAIVLVAPASELAVAKPAFRLTAFRHTGDYGINPPYNWDGSLWPAVAQGLQAFP